MTTVHLFHNLVAMSKHVAPPGFPERPTRLVGIAHALTDVVSACTDHLVTTPVDRDILVAEYGNEEITRWEAACASAAATRSTEMDDICNDVYWSGGSMEAVRIAVAAARAAVATALDADEGRPEHAFALIRPPGHHCFDVPAGFCIANNVVLAARLALERGKRVAILDWDYHFGDGTAAAFLKEQRVAFCSLHCETDRHGCRTYPLSPLKGSSLARRTRGRMFNINWELDDADNAAYITAIERLVIPAFRRFAPDVLLVSAGYDSLKGDALAGMNLTPNVFYELTVRLKELGVPIVAILEGGYDPSLLGRGVRATIEGLLAPESAAATLGGSAAPQHLAVIEAVEENLKSYDVIV
jgi:acetoin utilization deacetylase AcuC-like enzyme